MAAPSVVVVSQDRIGDRMAGPAIRSYEIARALGRQQPTVLATRYEPGIGGDGFDVRRYDDAGELAALVRGADVIVAFGSFLFDHPEVVSSDKVIVVDLYDPALLEALVIHQDEPAADQERKIARSLAVLLAQLDRGDLFLCASERQRELIVGMLMTRGRVNPSEHHADPALRSLVRVVPFGLPAGRPSPGTPEHPLRSRPGLAEDAIIFLWGGGIYEWLDPLVLIEAVALVEDARAKVVFLGIEHPTPDVAPMPVVARARERARELGLTDERVFFVEGWVPYAERGGYLLDADVGVSTHRDTLETSFAFRTRILDYLWAGLPVLCSDGDAFAELVRVHAVGDVVPIGDASALADAMRRLCSPHARAEAADQSSALGETYRWDTVLRPVVEFCRAPQPAAGRAEASRMLKTALSSNQHAAWTTRAVRKSRRLFRAAAHRGR